MPVADAQPLTPAEARKLFAPLANEPAIVIAVSGGPDSTALLWLASQWRSSRKTGPQLLAVTVDHGLRAESGREASAVKRFAQGLGVPHRTARWTGMKPKTGIQEAARHARYRLIGALAKKALAHVVLTAHTSDDQAETVLFRLMRGSGPSGLQAMMERAPYPGEPGLSLVRPLLTVPKARLVATLRKAGLAFADDPSNRDPRFARPRLRELMPALAAEGLTAERLTTLARRVQRAEDALRHAVSAAAGAVLSPSNGTPRGRGRVVFDCERFLALPAEIALRLLGQAVAEAGSEGPVELGKLEALFDALIEAPAGSAFRRTLAGAMVTGRGGELVIEPAPPRRPPAKARPVRRIPALTTRETVPCQSSGTR